MSTIKEIVSFKTFITPMLIRFGFWLGVFGGVVSFIGAIGFGIFSMVAAGEVAAGLAIMIGAVFYLGMFLLYWRVTCEIVLVVFGIYERLDETADAIKSAAGASAPATSSHHPRGY